MSACVFGLMYFETALTIFLPAPTVKPDPPSDVKVQEVEGRETYMKVTWNFPISWKSEDSYYKLIYEIKYKPLTSSCNSEQVCSGRPTDKKLDQVFFEHTYPVDVFLYFSLLVLLAGNKYSLVSFDDSMMCLPGCLSVCVSLDKDEFDPDLRNH